MRAVQDGIALVIVAGYSGGMNIRGLLSLSVLPLFALPNLAAARDYGEVAGWQMAASGNSCGLYSSRAGKGDLIFLKDLRGAVHIQVTNEFWRSDDGRDIAFAIDGKRWRGNFGIAPAKSKNGVGYVAAFDSRIIPLLRAGRQLAVQRGGRSTGSNFA